MTIPRDRESPLAATHPGAARPTDASPAETRIPRSRTVVGGLGKVVDAVQDAAGDAVRVVGGLAERLGDAAASVADGLEPRPGRPRPREPGTVPALDIRLPDLEGQDDVEIIADNVRAAQAIHYAAMLEEWRLFQAADRLVERFAQGRLPIGRGAAGDRLYAYWKASADRMSEQERRTLYTRVFGLPGGDPAGAAPNREFHDLFLRFLSSVSGFARQVAVDDLPRNLSARRVSAEQVRKAGRDLAVNLSIHGYGIAHYAALEIQAQIQEVMAILREPEIQSAYGARDLWQVVDQVATLELGGARNGVRYRTMAQAGAVIIRWLAENAARLCDALVLATDGPLSAGSALENPTDADLAAAVESWLAVTGTPDRRIGEYAEPADVWIDGEADFPAFVGDLIQGTFDAVVDASIQQMRAYADLVRDVAQSLEEFMDQNVSEDQGRDWLAEKWPDVLVIDCADEPCARRLALAAADGEALARISRELGLDPPVASLADEAEEGRLVAAARTRIARGRQQLLAAMVLMGINRIVVTEGRIRPRPA